MSWLRSSYALGLTLLLSGSVSARPQGAFAVGLMQSSRDVLDLMGTGYCEGVPRKSMSHLKQAQYQLQLALQQCSGGGKSKLQSGMRSCAGTSKRDVTLHQETRQTQAKQHGKSSQPPTDSRCANSLVATAGNRVLAQSTAKMRVQDSTAKSQGGKAAAKGPGDSRKNLLVEAGTRTQKSSGSTGGRGKASAKNGPGTNSHTVAKSSGNNTTAKHSGGTGQHKQAGPQLTAKHTTNMSSAKGGKQARTSATFSSSQQVVTARNKSCNCVTPNQSFQNQWANRKTGSANQQRTPCTMSGPLQGSPVAFYRQPFAGNTVGRNINKTAIRKH